MHKTEIFEKKIVYDADDGTRFNTEEECLYYEDGQKLLKKFESTNISYELYTSYYTLLIKLVDSGLKKFNFFEMNYFSHDEKDDFWKAAKFKFEQQTKLLKFNKFMCVDLFTDLEENYTDFKENQKIVFFYTYSEENNRIKELYFNVIVPKDSLIVWMLQKIEELKELAIYESHNILQ